MTKNTNAQSSPTQIAVGGLREIFEKNHIDFYNYSNPKLKDSREYIGIKGEDGPARFFVSVKKKGALAFMANHAFVVEIKPEGTKSVEEFKTGDFTSEVQEVRPIAEYMAERAGITLENEPDNSPV